MDFEFSEKNREWIDRLKAFMAANVYPNESVYWEQVNSGEPWKIVPILEDLKEKAKAEGLWNLFLDDPEYGAGLTNLEYASLAEITGGYPWCAEIFNGSAPDTGNMEVLARYGSPEQKEKWLVPLLDGAIRSAFAMTEPAVASSDATNIQTSIVRDGDEYVLNGRKWWTSGAGDPRCKLYVVMGRSKSDGPLHQQQSMILVPAGTPGITKVRPLRVFGYDDAPHGHFEISLEDVRVPAKNMLLGEGRGFEIAQGRLGPGRIHHCMRAIGAAERALGLMIARLSDRTAFGKKILDHSLWGERIAKARTRIDMARLLTLKAAHMMDTVGNKAARKEIAMIKVVAPEVSGYVIDMAIQAFGGEGVCQDQPLAGLYALQRTLRIADGPDEVHYMSIARQVVKNRS